MLIRNMLIKYYSAVGGEGGDGGSSSSGTPEIVSKIQKLIDEQVSTQAPGLRNRNSELLGKLKESTESLKRFEGTDPDAVKTILQCFSDDEGAQLIVAGKINEVLDKRTERLCTDVDKQIKAANGRVEKAEASFNKFRDRALGNATCSTALKAGALLEASSDLILRAKGTFRLSDEGKTVAVDADDDVPFSKGGKIPLTPVEWVESLKKTVPHLFPRTGGPGADGHKPGGGGDSLKRSEMSSSDKVDYIRRHGQQVYLKLPK